jgi:hypothetical protein
MSRKKKGEAMSGLDDISEAIGQLRATIEHIRRNTEVINGKLDRTTELCILADQSSKAAHQRIDGITDSINDTIAPKVDAHERFQNKQIGIVASVTFIISLIGTGVGKFILGFF